MADAGYRDELREVRIIELFALESLELGNIDSEGINRLHCMATIAEALNPARRPICAAARATLETDKPDVNIVRLLFQKYDADRMASRPDQYLKAVDMLQNKGLTVGRLVA